MKFLDAAYPQSVAQFDSALTHEGADDFAYYEGGNNALNAWDATIVVGLRSAMRRGMGIHVSTVVGRDGAVDGSLGALRNRQVYQAVDGDFFCWDLEPGIYRVAPATALQYGIAWATAVRTSGFRPVLYSTPDGCAAIGDKGFEAVWAAVPANCDPSTIFAPTFFPGMVAVQCGWGIWNGVEYDTNISQFAFTPALTSPPLTPSTIRRNAMTQATVVRTGIADPGPQGARDVFTVQPDGSLRHTVIQLDHSVQYNDTLPGQWNDVLEGYWAADGSLHFHGYGLSGGVYEVNWSPADATWHGPTQLQP